METIKKVNVIKVNSNLPEYSDDSSNITISKEWYGPDDTNVARCYITHIEFANYDRPATVCANDEYNNGLETTSHAAERLGAIFAINGNYSAPSLDYIVVRRRILCNGADRALWVPAVYSQELHI